LFVDAFKYRSSRQQYFTCTLFDIVTKQLLHLLFSWKSVRYLNLVQGFSTYFRPWTTMPFQITLWTPVDNQKINHTQKSIYTLHLLHQCTHCTCSNDQYELDSHCSYGFFRHGLYRWSATKVLLHKKI